MAASRLVAPLAALASLAAAVPFVPSVVLGNSAQAGVSMPFIGLGCGGYSSANNGYGAYPECWIGDGGATGGGSGTCGGFVQQAVTSWLEAGGRRRFPVVPRVDGSSLQPGRARSGRRAGAALEAGRQTGTGFPLGASAQVTSSSSDSLSPMSSSAASLAVSRRRRLAARSSSWCWPAAPASGSSP